MQTSKRIPIAKIGKTHGVRGYLRFHLLSDFVEQFFKKKVWSSSIGDIEIEDFLPEKSLIKFKGYDSPEDAKKLVNVLLYSTISESRELCELEKDEYFWFDIIGLIAVEEESNIQLGKIIDIERLIDADYLVVKTDDKLLSKQKLPKRFLIPFVDRYISSVEEGVVFVRGGLDILENS